MDPGYDVAKRCLAQLKEHWSSVTITCSTKDPMNGADIQIEFDWGEPDEDDDD